MHCRQNQRTDHERSPKANYVSVIADCGTDVSGRDDVIAYCRHVSGGVPVNRLVGLAELSCTENTEHN